MKNIPYSRQVIDSADIKEVIKVLKSDWITQGPKIKEFEDALCKYTGAKYAVAVSNGTAALHIACLAAGIKKGDEIITSPITFLASANCILYCGGKPVFADICKDTINIDPEEIGKKVNKKTKAIIPVHFAGHPCDLEEIYKIAKKNNLIVIEDAAHALGAEYKGSKIGACKHSNMTIFSFHPVKSITTGEGGAVLTNNKNLHKKLLLLRNHGVTKEKSMFKAKNQESTGGWYYEMQELGFNYRITDIQCALGISQLKKVDKFIQRKRQIVKEYNKAFKNNDFFDLPVEKTNIKSSWHLYPIRLKDKYKEKKKEIFTKLREKGIGAQVHYIPVYYQPYYQRLGYKKNLCIHANDFYQSAVSFPLYSTMANQDIKRAMKTFLNILRKVK